VKRKALSSRLLTEKILFFLLLAWILIFALKHYPELLWIAVPVFIYFEYMIYYRPSQIEFDGENLFIKKKRGEEFVALMDIYLVSNTHFGIGYKSIWKVKYLNNKGGGVARFYPRKLSSGFDDFIKFLKAVNPDVVIKI
jgi:hypothetical protein